MSSNTKPDKTDLEAAKMALHNSRGSTLFMALSIVCLPMFSIVITVGDGDYVAAGLTASFMVFFGLIGIFLRLMILTDPAVAAAKATIEASAATGASTHG
jgi:hypothetical protein